MSQNVLELDVPVQEIYVKQNEGDCLPASIMMAVKYWLKIFPDIGEGDLSSEDVKNFLGYMEKSSQIGTALARVTNYFTRELGHLGKWKFIKKHLKSIMELAKGLRYYIKIPQILIYDPVLMRFGDRGTMSHAVLLYGIDLGRKLLEIVDPKAENIHKNGDVIRFPFEDFEKGWAALENIDIIVYPENKVKISISSSVHSKDHRKGISLDEWFYSG